MWISVSIMDDSGLYTRLFLIHDMAIFLHFAWFRKTFLVIHFSTVDITIFIVYSTIRGRWTGRWGAKLSQSNTLLDSIYYPWMNTFFSVVISTTISLQLTHNWSQMDAWGATTSWIEGLCLQQESRRIAFLMHFIIRGGWCRGKVNKRGCLDTSEPLRALQKEAQSCKCWSSVQ